MKRATFRLQPVLELRRTQEQLVRMEKPVNPALR